MKIIVCIVADLFEDDQDWLLLFVTFLDYFVLAKSDQHTKKSFARLTTLLETFDEVAKRSLKEWSGSDLVFPKYHVLKHHLLYWKKFGAFCNFSANVLEALHQQFAKEPWRNSMGVGQDKQVVNYVTRHHSMEDLSSQVKLLHSVDKVTKKRKLTEEPALCGSHSLIKILDNFATLESAGTEVCTTPQHLHTHN